MNRIRGIAALAVLLAGLAGLVGLAGPAQAAEKAEAVGAVFRLADFEGQVVLVDFWASWCVPCRHSLPWLNDMQRKYGAQGLQVVTINVDKNNEAPAKMSATLDAGIRQFFDPEGKVAAAYELEGMPSSYLYGRDGQLIAAHVGFTPAEADEREAGVAAAVETESK